VVVPASPARWGWEPLCAFYSVRILPQLLRAVERGDLRLASLISSVETEILPLDEVRRWGDPEVTFLNVNTPEEHARAERILRSHPEPWSEGGRR
jgi:molybdopterin-guanine dinucleotide biosynthesis protein A